MAYLLDANVFMQAKNLYYGFDFCPAFWEWLVDQNAKRRVFSIEKVADEIAAGTDTLSDWAKQRGKGFFLQPDPKLPDSLGAVSQWVTSQSYRPAAINTFLQAADYYLVAHALAHQHVVVTHEVPSSSVNRIKIPDVCAGLGITCMTPYAMLRAERAKFVLGGNATKATVRREVRPDRRELPALPSDLTALIDSLGKRPSQVKLRRVLLRLTELSPWTPIQLATLLDLADPAKLEERHLSPMVTEGLLECTFLDNPTYTEQAYRACQRSLLKASEP